MRNSAIWTLLGAISLTAACSAPSADTLGTSQEALATPFANDEAAFDYFLGKGLTNFQAAAIVGNLDQESGVNPTISQEGGGVGRGIAQWSAGGRWDTDKNDNVLAFAAMEGKDPMSLGLQLDFMWYELTTFPDLGLDKLKASTNVTDATQAVEDNYEGCVYAQYPECALPQRVTYAKDVLAAYGNDPVPGGGGSGGASSGGTGASSGGAGTSTGGIGGSAPSAGGSANAAGSSSVAGTSSIGGSPSGVAGGSSTAGTVSTAGGTGSTNTAGTSSSAPTSTSADPSGCSVSGAGEPRSANHSLGFSGVLLALGLGLRITRRRRR